MTARISARTIRYERKFVVCWTSEVIKSFLKIYNAGDEEPTCVLVAVELTTMTVEVPWPGRAQPVF